MSLMKLAYFGANWTPDNSSGGAVHVRQFVETATALTHEIWAPATIKHPMVRHFSSGTLARAREYSRIECVYQRFDGKALRLPRLLRLFRRLRESHCPEVWELNTVPEFIITNGYAQHEVKKVIEELQLAARRCDLAVCVSQSIADYATDRLGIDRTIVVPNGSDPAMFSPDIEPVKRMQPFQEKLNVCWIGSAELGWHNFELIGQLGASLMKSSRSDIAIHIIGSGLRDIDHLPPNIHYHGYVSYERLPSWLAAMDVGLVTYRPGPGMYSSPLKLFDYMAAGLAIVSTEQPQVREILRQLDAEFFVVDYDDVDGLHARLTSLADDLERARAIGARARDVLCKKYRWQDNVETIFAAINRLKA